MDGRGYFKRGYFGIGIYRTKTIHNLGTLWRSAQNFGAAFIFTVGRRYKQQASDTLNTPKHVPLFHYEDFDDLCAHRPFDAPLIGIEQCDRSMDLTTFAHPERAIYLLGAEDNGLPRVVVDKCSAIIAIASPMCLNVSVAGSIVMFDRSTKRRSVNRGT